MSKVHRACLERWLAESAKNSCEICNYEYNTVRKPKVSKGQKYSLFKILSEIDQFMIAFSIKAAVVFTNGYGTRCPLLI